MSLVYHIEKQRCSSTFRCPYRAGVRWDKFTVKCFGDCLKVKVDDNWIEKEETLSRSSS
jgi:hypothetical protein